MRGSAAEDGAAPWHIFPGILVRVPALPRERVLAFGYHAALARHGEARTHGERVARAGRTLACAVGEVVPRAASRENRRTLLDLRRALHNARPLPAAYEYCLQNEPGDLPGRLRAWGVDRQRWITTSDAADAAFARSRVEVDGQLIASLSAPFLGCAARLSSESLARAISVLTQRETRLCSGDHRRALAAGARLLWRAGLRPTPNGLLAATGVTRLGPYASGGAVALAARRVIVRPQEELVRRWRSQALRSRVIFPEVVVRQPWAQGPDPQPPVAAACAEQSLPPAVGAAARLTAAFATDASAVLPVSELLRRGVAPDDILGVIAAGMAPWGVPVRSADEDSVTGLLRLLWEKVPGDLSLLHLIATLEDYRRELDAIAAGAEQALRGAPTPTGSRRLSSASHVHLARLDTALPARVEVDLADLQPFLTTVATFGAEWVDPDPAPGERVMAAVLETLFPHHGGVPFPDFYRGYALLCQRLRVPVEPWSNGPLLASALGLSPTDPATDVVLRDLEGLLRTDCGDVSYAPRRSDFEGWGPKGLRRLAVRFRRLGRIGDVRLCQLNFWGGPWMSLFPRYGDAARAAWTDVERAFADWLRHWPDIADVIDETPSGVDQRRSPTAHVIDLSAQRRQDSLSAWDLTVARDAAGGARLLIATTGERVRPVSFGVSHPRRMSAPAALLANLAGHGRTFLDIACEVVNGIHVQRLRSDDVTRIPAIRLGTALLLAPETFVVPAHAVPNLPTPVDGSCFFRFHDWLVSRGLPTGPVQVRIGLQDREPVWLDLAHPEGVHGFLQAARRQAPLTIYAPVALQGPGIPGELGVYDAEFYAEIAGGST